MMIAALTTLLIGRLPQHSAISMVAVVAGCLALAMVFGLQAVRLPRAEPHSAPLAQLSPEIARGP
jgi:hypothetical protein